MPIENARGVQLAPCRHSWKSLLTTFRLAALLLPLLPSVSEGAKALSPRCGLHSCTQAELGKKTKKGKTCGWHINNAMRWQRGKGPKDEFAACNRVGTIYPICGECKHAAQKLTCGKKACNGEIKGHTCDEWVKGWQKWKGLNEAWACKKVADKYPGQCGGCAPDMKSKYPVLQLDSPPPPGAKKAGSRPAPAPRPQPMLATQPKLAPRPEPAPRPAPAPKPAPRPKPGGLGTHSNGILDEAEVQKQCVIYARDQGCQWTAKFSCPGQPLGSKGNAQNDGSQSYNCCCKQNLWQAQPCGKIDGDYYSSSGGAGKITITQGTKNSACSVEVKSQGSVKEGFLVGDQMHIEGSPNFATVKGNKLQWNHGATWTPTGPATLKNCIQWKTGWSIWPGQKLFFQAKHCRNYRADYTPHPLAVVRVKTKEEVQDVVKCAVQFGKEVCARSGAHGYSNDAGCTGGVMIDVQDLEYYKFDAANRQVTFGAGHTHGMLYYRLANWETPPAVVPLGTEGDVGTSGLLLGCGRGMLTMKYGMACDSLLEVEFVNAVGEIEIANKWKNPNMLWMAKGSGGNFPGIAINFKMQAFDAPKNIKKKQCKWELNKIGTAGLFAWGSHSQALAKEEYIFTHVGMKANPSTFEWESLCFDCEGNANMGKFYDKINKAYNDITEWSGVGPFMCKDESHSWISKLIDEPGVEGWTPQALLKTTQWPFHYGGVVTKKKWGAENNFARMIPHWQGKENHGQRLALYNEIYKYFVHEKTPGNDPYTLMSYIYIMAHPKVTKVSKWATPYGGRDGKWVMLIKHVWHPDNNWEQEMMKAHAKKFSLAIDKHLPCKSFINYIDKDLTCAKDSNHDFLAAHFSDVGKMRDIKSTRDPHHVFRSRLHHCAQPACTPWVMHNKFKFGFSCATWIWWYRTLWSGGEIDSCRKVAKEWFPSQCGACNPDR